MEKTSQKELHHAYMDHKASSTGCIMTSSTITNPDAELVIKGVSTLLHANLLDDIDDKKKVNKGSDAYYFDEEKYMAEMPNKFDEERKKLLRQIPTQEDVSGFISELYDIAQFSPECCVICIIYINRIISLTNMPMLPTTWRPLILVSLMVAQKMWDDKYLNNSDFITIYPFFDNKQLNVLEMKFLEMIQYNTHIKFSTYTQYFLEIKGLEPDCPLKPMDVCTLARLNKQSKIHEDNLKKKAKTSARGLDAGQKTAVVIN